MKKFIIVNRDLHEIYLNQFDGTLPPMTEQEIKEYFNDGSLLSIAQKHNLTFYEASDKHCPHCDRPLTRSETKGYVWQCFYCDEDFGDFQDFYELNKLTLKDNEERIIKIAKEIYNKQNDISYCQAETGIYEIETIDIAIKFLNWIKDNKIFDYEFKRG